MSARMSVSDAREWVMHDKSTRSTARAARTVVAQAEQIERLQKAVAEAEVIFWEATGHDMEQQLERRGVTLKHGDMEPPA